jgi:hypothetical protein
MRPQANENMNMVGHAVYLHHLVFIFLKNAGDVLMQSWFPFFLNEGSTVFYSKCELNVSGCASFAVTWENLLFSGYHLPWPTFREKV